ncbi:hypothetical protein T484DRAFT_1940187 [Baffinella frigidus]|nr:hypothetical protein T484DRAFT_1940187 [Cryptophyta sp. CCMP2293]
MRTFLLVAIAAALAHGLLRSRKKSRSTRPSEGKKARGRSHLSGAMAGLLDLMSGLLDATEHVAAVSQALATQIPDENVALLPAEQIQDEDDDWETI